jgi:chemotaxis protein CheX
MAAPQYCAEDFLSECTLEQVDATVAETFGVMLGLATQQESSVGEDDPIGEDARTGLIGFSGALRGSCEVRMDTAAARTIASAMLGGAPIEDGDEDSVNDSVGEIANMLSAGWKNRIESLSGGCFLSPPTVISGKSYKVHPSHASIKIVRHYAFEAHRFQIAIHCVEFGG